MRVYLYHFWLSFTTCFFFICSIFIFIMPFHAGVSQVLFQKLGKISFQPAACLPACLQTDFLRCRMVQWTEIHIPSPNRYFPDPAARVPFQTACKVFDTMMYYCLHCIVLYCIALYHLVPILPFALLLVR